MTSNCKTNLAFWTVAGFYFFFVSCGRVHAFVTLSSQRFKTSISLSSKIDGNNLLDKIPKSIPFFSKATADSPPVPPSIPPPLNENDIQPFEATPEFLIAKAKSVIATDLAVQDPTLLGDDFIWIGPLSETPLGKVDYLAAGRFFDLRSSFPDLDYRGHDFRIDANDSLTVRCTVRTLGTMRGSLRLRNQIVQPNGAQWRGPPEAVSMTFDEKTGKVVKLCSSFAMDRQVGNSNGLCGVMGAATVAGVPPSDWEVFSATSVISRIFGRPVYPLEEVTTFLAPFPETVMIQLTKGILSSNLASDDSSLLAESFSFVTPSVGPVGKKAYLESYAAQEFQRLNPEFSNFRVDPYDPNRVWADVKPIGPSLEGPPQAFSFSFDDDGFCTRITAGAVMDPTIGNTGGLSGPEGIRYSLGQGAPAILTRPLPLALGRIKKNLLSPITKIAADDYVLTVEKDESNVATAKVEVDKSASALTALQESLGNGIFVKNDDETKVKKEFSLEQEKAVAEEKRQKAVARKKKAQAEAAEKRRIQAEEKAASLKLAAEKRKLAAEKKKATQGESRLQLAEKRQSEAKAKKAAQAESRRKLAEKKQVELEEREAAKAEAQRKQEEKRLALVEKKKLEAEGKKAATQRLLAETEKRKAQQVEARRRESSLKASQEKRRLQTEEKKAAQAQALKKKEEERRAIAEQKKIIAQERRATEEEARRRKLDKLKSTATKSKPTAKRAPRESPSPSFSLPGLNFGQQTSSAPASPRKKEARPSLFAPPKPKPLTKAPNGVPTIIEWRSRRDGGISGRIFGSRNFEEGDRVETSEIVQGEIDNGFVVTTDSGSRYFLSSKSRKEMNNNNVLSKPLPKELLNAKPGATIQLTKKKKEEDAKAALEALKNAKPRATLSLAALFGIDDSEEETSQSSRSSSAKSAPKGVPELKRWKQNRDESITGFVSGSPAFRNGEKITTSPIGRGNVAKGEVVVTTSGSKYFLQ